MAEIVPLLSAGGVKRHVRSLAVAASGKLNQPRRVSIIGILNGAMMLTADFAREWHDIHHGESVPWVGFIRIRSYDEDGKQIMPLVYSDDSPRPIPADQPAILLDTVIDTGATIVTAQQVLPQVQLICALAVKEDKVPGSEASRMTTPILTTWYVKGDPWLVGYGMDSNGLYRDLPYVGKVVPDTPQPSV